MFVRLSFRLSAWNKPATTGGIYIKFQLFFKICPENFMFMFPCIISLYYKIQRDATMSSQYFMFIVPCIISLCYKIQRDAKMSSQYFMFMVPCIISLYYEVQRDATMSSQYFISLQYYSTFFGCSLHPSSGVQETVVTAIGMVIYLSDLGGVKG
jgi:hypothetical protein